MNTSLKPDTGYFTKHIYATILTTVFVYIFFVPFCLFILGEKDNGRWRGTRGKLFREPKGNFESSDFILALLYLGHSNHMVVFRFESTRFYRNAKNEVVFQGKYTLRASSDNNEVLYNALTAQSNESTQISDLTDL